MDDSSKEVPTIGEEDELEEEGKVEVEEETEEVKHYKELSEE